MHETNYSAIHGAIESGITASKAIVENYLKKDFKFFFWYNCFLFLIVIFVYLIYQYVSKYFLLYYLTLFNKILRSMIFQIYLKNSILNDNNFFSN